MYRRTEALIGKENIDRLAHAHVAVFGIGGVGSYICEGLARAGIGTLTLVDDDTIAPSNINRQLHALHSTIGTYKVDAMKTRILDINPRAIVHPLRLRFLPDNEAAAGLTWDFDYIADAVDTVTAKIALAQAATQRGIPIISAMGTGNKLDPARFQLGDIYETSVCPLAKVMRKELRRCGIDRLRVLYSTEPPITPTHPDAPTDTRTPASISFVPSVAGLMIAGEMIRSICAL